MNADRRAWEVIGDLLAHGWQLDDAISEVVEVRNELSSMLQAFPWIPKFEPPRGKGWFKGKPPSKPKGKGRGFGLKEAFSGKERTPCATTRSRRSVFSTICLQGVSDPLASFSMFAVLPSRTAPLAVGSTVQLSTGQLLTDYHVMWLQLFQSPQTFCVQATFLQGRLYLRAAILRICWPISLVQATFLLRHYFQSWWHSWAI